MIPETLQISNLFTITPSITLPENIRTYRAKRINTDSQTVEELNEFFEKNIVGMLYNMPVGRYKQITFGKKGYLKYPKVHNPVKTEFLQKMEKYINGTWNIRERTSYLVCEDNVDKTILEGEIKDLFEPVDEDKFREDLAYFFDGDKGYPFGKTITAWEHGFKVGNKYAIGLIQYGVGDKIVPYASDFLNKINVDFIDILHFEAMDSLAVESKISRALTIAEKTGMPNDVLIELNEFRNQAILGKATLAKFFHVLYLFADSEEEAIQLAYRVKSIPPYKMAFEGDFEFDGLFSLVDFDFLKGKDMAGVLRHSTLDYLASLLYVSGRYNGEPKDRFIPMLNEAFEPAYVPVDKNLFNLGAQGQMGSGKSVSLQYLATMFDMTCFIEKIQSDVGSYAIYCKYFDGDYIPISLDVEVSINPLGKAYEYFRVNIYSLAKALGIERPHEYFDDKEAFKISDILSYLYFEKHQGKVEKLTAKEMIEELLKDKDTLRMVKLLEKNPELEWKVDITVNSSKKTFVVTMLSFMYAGEDENLPNFSEIKAYLEKIADEFYEKNYKEDLTKELLISDLYKFVEDEAEEGKIKTRLLSRLYSFKKGGKFGHLFDKPTDIRQDVEHIFFEVRLAEKEIIPIAMMTIMDYVDKVYGSVRYRGKTKFVIIDEGWFFMNIEMAKNFIDEAFRTYRKRGISIGFGTQNPKDYEKMLNYIPYVWILYLENPKEAVEVYGLTERDYELIKSIDKPKAYNFLYSKVFLKFKNNLGKNEKGLFILPSYPEFRWIAETDPEFKMMREQAIVETGSLRKAIEKLSFGNG